MVRMLHVLILRYSGSPIDATPHVDGHVAYLERHHSHGFFLLSGQTEPVEDGGVILARGDRARVERIAAEDPFVRHGIATYEIISVLPGRMHPKLTEWFVESVDPVVGSDETRRQWVPEQYRRLRASAPDLADSLEGRPLEPVLQRAGSAVLSRLNSGSTGLTALARRCAAGLRQRDWVGDDVLAEELERALGDKPGEGELAPTPVDLEMLVEALDTDPAEGAGSFDPLTGEVLLGVLSFGDFEDEDLDETVEERRIEIVPGSREVYLDMVDFAETVADPQLRGRLRRALDGRGAFRRFKDTIHDEGGDQLSAWTVIGEERALGRARQWLAEHGYRPQE